MEVASVSLTRCKIYSEKCLVNCDGYKGSWGGSARGLDRRASKCGRKGCDLATRTALGETAPTHLQQDYRRQQELRYAGFMVALLGLCAASDSM